MIEPASWLPGALGLRLVVAAAVLALARRPGAARRAGFLGAVAGSLVTTALAARVLLTGRAVSGLLFAHTASGLSLGFRVDALGAWFLVVLGLLAIPVSVFSLGYLPRAVPPSRWPFVAVAFNVLLAAMEAIFAADGAIGFLFAWELMTLATAALVATEHEHAQTRRAAFLYLVLSHAGTGCLVAGFFLLSTATGALDFVGLAAGAGALGPARDLAFVLFLAGFGVKAGLIPLHVWLPDAHPAAPSNISALMSGVVIKTGIYGIVRVCVTGLGTPRLAWGVLVLGLGGASAILGVLYALMQHDLKRLLAYHSIENIGIILLGLGAGMVALAEGQPALAALGLAAGLLHVLNHAVFKGLLFLGAGTVVGATGTRNIEEMGGLARRMPWTSLFFLIAAAAISGLPLLNGFVSEWMVFQTFLLGFTSSPRALIRFVFPIGGAALALTSALAAACFVKAFGITFLARPRSARAAAAVEGPPTMLLPQAFLAVLCVVLGLAPALALAPLGRVLPALPLAAAPGLVSGLRTSSAGGRFDALAPLAVAVAVAVGVAFAAVVGRTRLAVRRSESWGCGGVLDAANEYTATAFSKPLMMVFRAIYRPTREVSRVADLPYFPREVRYRAHIEPTFERFLYRPLTRVILGGAERLKVIQAGSLHAYLAYVIALMVGLLLVVSWVS